LQDHIISNKKYIITVAGPTASGKSTLAIRLAKYFDAEIISADSRQIYKEMNIGTAKPSSKDLKEILHHFINHISIEDEYSAGKFETEVLAFLKVYFTHKDIAILVGGTGLYLRAVLEGFDDFPDTDAEVLLVLEQLLQEKGLTYLGEMLKTKDSEYYQKVDLSNSRRVIRALSIIESTGKTYSSFLKNSSTVQRDFESINILLDVPRAQLYSNINQRVEEMLLIGLEEEVKMLIPYKDKKSLQTVGYAELFEYFAGKIDYASSIELIKRNSRRYAKRQMTWFRKYGDWQTFTPEELDKIIDYIENKINN
jgi:tRNA dimethylallyltransferase